MDVVIPWSRPGYLIGAHPLMLSYLHHSGDANVLFRKEFPLGNVDESLRRIKRRASEVALRLLAAQPKLSVDTVVEFLANRGSLSRTELFMEDPKALVFHHAALYPLETKFVLHFENPLTLFFPFLWYTPGRDFRLHRQPFFQLTKAALESDSCRLLLGHMKTFTSKLGQIFQSDVISRKTRLIRPHIPVLNAKPARQIKTVMFSNSFNSSDERFFLRGGLAAVSAFLNVAKAFPEARLLLFSRLPDSLSPQLKAQIEASKNITVVPPGISEEEMSALCAQVDILVNPSTGLHSMTILRGMSAGSLVIASDIVGNEEYITHGHNGIILPGVRERVNYSDPESGLSFEDYSNTLAINQEAVAPLTELLNQALSNPGKFHEMRMNAVRYVAENFSYGAEHCNLWEVLRTLEN